jgi:hypothetical protein
MKPLLDSGAYSAWSGGGRVDLDPYIDFIKQNKQFLSGYVTLDKIPGENGRRDNDPVALEHAASISYRNHQKMRNKGLNPIPVIHRGERDYWLEKYLLEGEGYIGLSPGPDDRRAGIDWLDRCMKLLTVNGRPLVKVHVFGTTVPSIA